MASYQCRGKKKLWSVRFSVIEDGKEVQKRLSGYTKKKDAETAYVEFIKEQQKNQKIISQDKNIFERYFEDVFEEYFIYKKTNLKESTYYELDKIKQKHLYPFFKGLKIKNISKMKILEWQNSLNEYSYGYKSKLRIILHSFYKYLYLYYDIDNIVSKVEPFKKPNTKKEMQIWTLEEFNKFIKTFDKDTLFKTFFMLLYYTGCRLGEILALNYNSFNFEEKTINISKSISSKVYDSDKSYSITSPKNYSSFRKIIMPDIIINQLKDYITEFPDSKTSLFFLGNNSPLDDNTIYRRLKEHSKQAGVNKIRIHDFRHSHASLLIQLGANVVLVAKRLGHSNTQQTLNTYAHLFPNTENELVEKMNLNFF